VTQLLSDLREPPVVGRFYLVPVVRHKWHGKLADWPVIGPMHTDREFFKFTDKHYHVDHRFLGARETAFALRNAPTRYRNGGDDKAIALICSGYLLAESWHYGKLPAGRPTLARRRCSRPHTHTPILHHMTEALRSEFRAHYGDNGDTAALAAPAIKLEDGRRLCPHRKADLSSLPSSGDGVVTCPLHGLKVCVR
jgi:hypothetical protein